MQRKASKVTPSKSFLRSSRRFQRVKTLASQLRNASVALAALTSICTFGHVARADDSLDQAIGEGRLRLAPRIGGGIAAIGGHAAPFPHVIGLSELGGEISYETVPWGGWVQGSFLSSGAAGQWNTPSLGIGASLRVFGDGISHASILFRAGLTYEPWHAASNACSVYLFVPTSCRTFAARDPNAPNTQAASNATIVDDNGQLIGVLAGVRLELPLRRAYLAIDSSFVPAVGLGDNEPGSAFSFRLAILFGFRDRRVPSETVGPAPDTRHLINGPAR